MENIETNEVIFTSDCHGNIGQYKKVFDYCISNSIKTIIFGGDISPKRQEDDDLSSFLKRQKQWLQKEFLQELIPFAQKGVNCFVSLGNGDCVGTLENHLYLEKKLNGFYKLMNFKREKIGKYEIVGYPFVSFSYSSIKDFEKFDLSVPPKLYEDIYKIRKEQSNLKGYRSSENGQWNRIYFTQELEKNDSIQKDLNNELFTTNSKNTIYILHGPPYGTSLDITSKNQHVGSIAFRIFIEKYQPYLTLSGHVHEAVQMSGSFVEKIGYSTCFGSGNSPYTNTVAIIKFDLNNLSNVQRFTL